MKILRAALIWGAATTLALLASVSPSWAKGSTLTFDSPKYEPGQQATGQADVQTWPGSGQEADGPFTVYLVKGKQPLWYRHLPKTAIEVGQLTSVQRGRNSFRATASFEVPATEPGTYAVWACNEKCRTGFGDLVDGSITVDGSATGDGSASGANVEASSPSQVDSSPPWVGIAVALALVIGAGVLMASLRRKRQHAHDRRGHAALR